MHPYDIGNPPPTNCIYPAGVHIRFPGEQPKDQECWGMSFFLRLSGCTTAVIE